MNWCFVTWDKNYVTTLKIYTHWHAHTHNAPTGRRNERTGERKTEIASFRNEMLLHFVFSIWKKKKKRWKRHEVASCHACIQTCKTLYAVLFLSLHLATKCAWQHTIFAKIELKCGKFTILSRKYANSIKQKRLTHTQQVHMSLNFFFVRTTMRQSFFKKEIATRDTRKPKTFANTNANKFRKVDTYRILHTSISINRNVCTNWLIKIMNIYKNFIETKRSRMVLIRAQIFQSVQFSHLKMAHSNSCCYFCLIWRTTLFSWLKSL